MKLNTIFNYSQEDQKKQEYYARFIARRNEYELINLGLLKSECCVKNLGKLHEEKSYAVLDELTSRLRNSPGKYTEQGELSRYGLNFK